MGENQRVYGQPEKNPVITVSAITHRKTRFSEHPAGIR